MSKLLCKISEIREDETGGALLIATPYFAVLFMLLVALVFNVAIWLQKRQELQYAADAATRAATLAIEKKFPVLQNNGKYHVFCMLNEDDAEAYAREVLEANIQNMNHMSVTRQEIQPTVIDGVSFVNPEWSTADYQYHDKHLSVVEQYQNGDFSMYLEADVDGVLDNLLGSGNSRIKVKVYSQSMASGAASK